nr:hypothetical protein [Candidatus Woesearchaeota archaeon]
MTKKIKLVDIVSGEDFLREIHRAASLSYEHNKESGFSVYTDESFSQPYVNKAVLGEERTASSDMIIGHKHEPNSGYHIPYLFYRLIHLHFHPPKSNLHPSHGDIFDYLNARIANTNLRDSSSSEFERKVYEKEDNTQLKGFKIDYANPISMIGLVRNKPDNIELLVYQGITEEPISIYKFCKFVSNYCTKLYRIKDFEPEDTEIYGFPTRFRSTKKVVEFLNVSKYLRAINVKIKNGKLSSKDLEKLSKFQLIQTQFSEASTF